MFLFFGGVKMKKLIFKLVILLIFLSLLGGCSMYGISINEIRLYKDGGASIKLSKND
jgi:hypothetical protein